MILRLGINPITRTNDDVLAIGGDILLKRRLQEIRFGGDGGKELDDGFSHRAEDVGPMLAWRHLRLVSGWHHPRVARLSSYTKLGFPKAQALAQAIGSTRANRAGAFA